MADSASCIDPCFTESPIQSTVVWRGVAQVSIPDPMHRRQLCVDRLGPQCWGQGPRASAVGTLRHTTALHLLQSGVAFNIIALWLGHASVNSPGARRGRPLCRADRALVGRQGGRTAAGGTGRHCDGQTLQGATARSRLRAPWRMTARITAPSNPSCLPAQICKRWSRRKPRPPLPSRGGQGT